MTLKGRIGILTSMEMVPTTQSDLAPAFIFQFHHRIGVSPCPWLLEGEAVAMDPRPPPTAVGTWLPVQNAVAAQADESPTRFLSQRSQEAIVPILGISHNEVQVLLHLC